MKSFLLSLFLIFSLSVAKGQDSTLTVFSLPCIDSSFAFRAPDAYNVKPPYYLEKSMATLIVFTGHHVEKVEVLCITLKKKKTTVYKRYYLPNIPKARIKEEYILKRYEYKF